MKPLRSRLWAWQHRWAPYLFVAPFVILFAFFLLYPLGRSLVLSFYKTIGLRQARFVGLDNFRFLLADRVFWLALANTIGFTLAFLAIQIPLSLGLAVLLNNRRLRGKSLFRFAFFSTYLVGPVFVAVLFGKLLGRGTTGYNLLGDPNLALPIVLLAAIWLSVGFAMVYFEAAMHSVDRDLYDAAQVDGAGSWSQFWHITLPSISPVVRFMVLVSTIGALQLFELPYVLFQQSAGPLSRGMTVVMYLFITGWSIGDLGYASAIGWTLAALITVLAVVQWKIGSWVDK